MVTHASEKIDCLKAAGLSKVTRGHAQQAQVIPPFQYYSEVGESIFNLHFSNHRYVAQHYLHFSATGNLIAQLRVGDPAPAALDLAELQSVPAADGDFATLLAEMHALASSLPQQQYNPAERESLLRTSREKPVVIGGCGRSGTTLLLSILGAHPSILAFDEELYAFYPKPFRLSRVLGRIAAEQGDTWRRWCEKTPKNVRTFAEISELFSGNVHLVHIVRDGRDVVLSHHPNDATRYYISPERWVADVTAGLQFKGRVHLIRYEDLVSNPREALTSLCAFIEEDFSEQLLAYEKSSAVKNNKAWETAATPLSDRSVGRWQLPEHTARLQEFMEYPGASDLLTKLGYI